MKQTIVALICLIGILFSSFPVLAKTAEELEDELLGTVSAQYESNGDPGLISSGNGDLGGASYGAYQFASKYNTPYVFAKWCISSNNGVEVGNKLVAAYEKDQNTLGETFNTTWKQIAAEDKQGFLRLQRIYVKAKYYDPAVSALQKYFGLDISLYGIAFKNAVWSRTLQHGLGSYDNQNGFLGILKWVSEATPGGLLLISEEALITAIYEESGGITDTGTNPMVSANAGGNAWIIEEYSLEGKYMKYFSGNSAAVQAGVYLRLRVKEIQKLLEMLAIYGGYPGEENGSASPVLKGNKLLISSCDTMAGLYSSTSVALSISDVNKKEGSGALNFLPLVPKTDYSVILKTQSTMDLSNAICLQFYLYLPNVVLGEDAILTVSGWRDGTCVPLESVSCKSLTFGWQQIRVPLKTKMQTNTLMVTLQNLPDTVIAQRFMLDEIAAIYETTAMESYTVTADLLHCRTTPSVNGTSLGCFTQNTKVIVLGYQNGWFLCSGNSSENAVLYGWCSSKYLQSLSQDGTMGDLNSDGKISAIDALYVLQYTVEKRQFSVQELTLADMNNDGNVNARDALLILQISVQSA